MTVSAVSKENLELVTKTRILDQDVRNFKEQLRVINEKWVPRAVAARTTDGVLTWLVCLVCVPPAAGFEPCTRTWRSTASAAARTRCSDWPPRRWRRTRRTTSRCPPCSTDRPGSSK